MTEDLAALERRVAEKWAAALAARLPPDLSDLDGWLDGWSPWSSPLAPLGSPQFPREQWVSYPAKRTVTLLLVDRMLDAELDEAQWLQASFLMQFGGRERL